MKREILSAVVSAVWTLEDKATLVYMLLSFKDNLVTTVAKEKKKSSLVKA